MREIDRDEWPTFLDRFSRTHKDWLVSVAIENGVPDEPLDQALKNMPLKDLFLDQAEDQTKLVVIVGDAEIPYDIINPRTIVYEQMAPNNEKRLRIEAGLGYATLVEFHPPGPPVEP